MRIFISSSFSDIQYHQVAKDAILSVGDVPFLPEEDILPVIGKTPQEVINDAISDCDGMVAIFGPRLGDVAPGTDVPWTVVETRLATKLLKHVFVYVTRDVVTSEDGSMAR